MYWNLKFLHMADFFSTYVHVGDWGDKYQVWFDHDDYDNDDDDHDVIKARWLLPGQRFVHFLSLSWQPSLPAHIFVLVQ